METPLLLHNASRIVMISPERSSIRFIYKQTERRNLYRNSNLSRSFILLYQFLYEIKFLSLSYSLPSLMFHIIDLLYEFMSTLHRLVLT